MLIITSPTSTTWTPKHVSHNTTPRRQSVCPYSYTPHSVHMLDHHQHHRNVAIHRSRLTTRPNNCVPSTCPNTSVRVLNRENSGPSTTSQSPSTSSKLSLNPYGASSSASLKYVNCTISNYDTSKWIRIISFSLSKKTRIFIENTFFSRFRSTMSTLSIILVESTQNTFNYEEESSVGECG